MKRALVALALLPIVALFLFVTVQPLKVLPRIAPAPGYALRDERDERLTSEMMRGQVVLYTFAPVGCEGESCPATIERLREVQAALAARPELPPLRVVVVGLDAQAQSAEARAAAEQRWSAGASGEWSVVSGEAERVKMLVGDGFRTYYGDREDGTMEVVPAIVLVDPLGVIRAEYQSRIPPAATIVRDLGVLASEARNSEGAARLAYEAAHLFQCYSR